MIVKCVLAFPTESAEEMVRRFGDGPTWPEGIDVLGPYYFRVLGEGLRSLTVFRFEDERAPEVLAAIRRYPKRYIGIPGFTYIFDVGLEIEEFLDLVGEASP